MKSLLKALLGTTALLATFAPAAAELQVAASIKPVHSLVAGVMDGVGQPSLIVEGAGSPHTYSLKPSQAAAIENADLVFWVGAETESFLSKPIETIGANATTVALIDAPGLIRLPFREGSPFEAHGHDDDDHDEMAEGEHDGDHEHEEMAASELDGEHDHGGFDGHVWLDPENAKIFVGAIEKALVQHDPDNAGAYQTNAAALTAKLDALIGEVDATLVPVRGKGFVVFHDAYHYFENRFGVTAAGSITVSPDVIPGAERIGEIQAKVAELGATCVFAEPQFEPKLVAIAVEGTDAQSGVLDPLGADLEDGPDLYFDLIRNLARSMRDCLAEAS